MAGALRVLLHNWHLKLAALGLAILLWALVQTEPLSQETFASVPIAVQVMDSTWTVARPPSPATAELQLGGPAREIIRLARDGTILRIPVTSVGSRDTVIALQREWVDLGGRSRVTVESVSPLTVSLTFEPAVARNVHVVAPLRGELPADVALASLPEITPSTVVVRGPESRIMGLDTVRLVPLDLGSVRESGSFSLPVDTTGLPGAVVRPATVTVNMHVEPMVERVIDNVPIQAEPPQGQPSAVITPASLQLRLEGPSALVTSVDLSDVVVAVDPESLRGLEEGEMRRVRIRVDGVPPLVSAYLSADVATARRAEGSPGGGAGR
ncbi:MAG: YbbR-like domain-containing protein [Gemmatimonadales bacterium]